MLCRWQQCGEKYPYIQYRVLHLRIHFYPFKYLRRKANTQWSSRCHQLQFPSSWNQNGILIVFFHPNNNKLRDDFMIVYRDTRERNSSTHQLVSRHYSKKLTGCKGDEDGGSEVLFQAIRDFLIYMRYIAYDRESIPKPLECSHS